MTELPKDALLDRSRAHIAPPASDIVHPPASGNRQIGRMSRMPIVTVSVRTPLAEVLKLRTRWNVDMAPDLVIGAPTVADVPLMTRRRPLAD